MDRLLFQLAAAKKPTFVLHGHVWVNNSSVNIKNNYCFKRSSDLCPLGTVLLTDTEMKRSLIYVHPGSHILLK